MFQTSLIFISLFCFAKIPDFPCMEFIFYDFLLFAEFVAILLQDLHYVSLNVNR